MFNKVLVGVDGHDGGLDAAALARQLVAPDGELLLTHIHGGYPLVAKAETGDYERVIRDDAETLLAQASEQTGIRARILHGSSSVGRGLRELVERESADLVVVGSTRRGPTARIFLGDDTRETLRDVRSAVAIAPAGYADAANAIGKIGVALDASPESRGAATLARELAKALHAKLSAIEVLDVPMYIFYSSRPREGMPAQDPLKVVANEISQLGEFEPYVRFGYVEDELAKASVTVDLLVMGSRSLGRVRRLVETSRSQDIARRARCPLWSCPKPQLKPSTATARSTNTNRSARKEIGGCGF
jgi:nucleotide-binding universal stress UspA family protein